MLPLFCKYGRIAKIVRVCQLSPGHTTWWHRGMTMTIVTAFFVGCLPRYITRLPVDVQTTMKAKCALKILHATVPGLNTSINIEHHVCLELFGEGGQEDLKLIFWAAQGAFFSFEAIKIYTHRSSKIVPPQAFWSTTNTTDLVLAMNPRGTPSFGNSTIVGSRFFLPWKKKFRDMQEQQGKGSQNQRYFDILGWGQRGFFTYTCWCCGWPNIILQHHLEGPGPRPLGIKPLRVAASQVAFSAASKGKIAVLLGKEHMITNNCVLAPSTLLNLIWTQKQVRSTSLVIALHDNGGKYNTSRDCSRI